VIPKAHLGKLFLLLAALLLLLLAVVLYVRREVLVHFVRDALQTAAYAIHAQLRDHRNGLDPEAIQQVFVHHHRASVSPIWFDNAGNPVDAWGTPFRVSHDQAQPVAWVLCESAGPDREFGTADDLRFRSTD
jgi:hypothetical protein